MRVTNLVVAMVPLLIIVFRKHRKQQDKVQEEQIGYYQEIPF